MNIEEIQDFAFPITDEDRRCNNKMQKKMWQREKLRLMVERYKRGELINFEPLLISVNKDVIIQMINN